MRIPLPAVLRIASMHKSTENASFENNNLVISNWRKAVKSDADTIACGIAHRFIADLLRNIAF